MSEVAMHKAIELPLKRAAHWLCDQIIQDVPDEMARCEFQCSKLACSQGEWESCARRLQAVEDLRRWRASQ
jgi:hypothetical protein